MKIIVPFIILIFMLLAQLAPAQTLESTPEEKDSVKISGIERSASFAKPVNGAVKIYPNPTDGELTIELDNSTNDERIELLDLLGNKVLETAYHKTLNLSYLARGVYFLKLLDKNNRLIVMERIIKK